MKKMLILAAMAAAICTLAKPSSAQVATGQRVYYVMGSTLTVSVVSVSSSTPTQMDSASILVKGRTYFEIQNQDANNAIYCSEKSNVSTTTGRAIYFASATAPTDASRWVIPATDSGDNGRLTIYCISANSSASSRAIVVQGR
jgi:hypothetical protein